MVFTHALMHNEKRRLFDIPYNNGLASKHSLVR